LFGICFDSQAKDQKITGLFASFIGFIIDVLIKTRL